MWRDNLRAIYYIALKDMKTYYFKPPAVSWGIVFPITWILAFYLRMPGDFRDLVPGLIAMTILFSTTAAEAVVINFELRLGSLERLLLAPVTASAVLMGKILGGALFGMMMTAIVTVGSILVLGLQPHIGYMIIIIIVSCFLFSTLGALLCVMVKEVFEAQTLLNLPRFIMIFLCGVVYPISKMPVWLQYVSHSMPLTYAVNGLRNCFTEGVYLPASKDIVILLGFTIFLLFAARVLFRKKFE
jgi:ABC-2 type transport system permease protein